MRGLVASFPLFAAAGKDEDCRSRELAVWVPRGPLYLVKGQYLRRIFSDGQHGERKSSLSAGVAGR